MHHGTQEVRMRSEKKTFSLFLSFENYLNLHTMANANLIPFNQTPAGLALRPTNFHRPTQDPAMEEVLSLLETEPINALVVAPSVDIPALREQLSVLISTGRCKEAIGASLTHEQVRRLDEKDVIKYSKRYEAYVGAKTTESLIESFLCFTTKALSMVLKIKEPNALMAELKNDYIINKELSQLSGSLALRCGRMLAVANGLLITAKHVDFSQVTDEQMMSSDEHMMSSDEQKNLN